MYLFKLRNICICPKQKWSVCQHGTKLMEHIGIVSHLVGITSVKSVSNIAREMYRLIVILGAIMTVISTISLLSCHPVNFDLYFYCLLMLRGGLLIQMRRTTVSQSLQLAGSLMILHLLKWLSQALLPGASPNCA
jgi:hypothetical protein